MKPAIALFRNEFRLLLRNPAVVIWTVLIPVVAIIVMSWIPAARQPQPGFGGLSVIEAYQPTLIVFAATMLALQMMPMFIGQYRELGFLRRLRTTPAHSRDLLAAILGLVLVISVVVGLVLLALPLVFGVGVVGRLGMQLVLLVLVATSFLGVGSMLAGVIPNPRVASGVGAAVAAVMWFFAGMWFPRAQFPDWLATVSSWTPGGAAASVLDAAAAGGPIGSQALLALGLWTVVGFAIAARSFRWE